MIVKASDGVKVDTQDLSVIVTKLNPVGDNFIVHSKTNGDQTNQAISGIADGKFVVAWRDPNDQSQGEIMARILDLNGDKYGQEFVVNTSTAGVQTNPVITSFGNGNFVIAWEDWYGEGSQIEFRESIQAQLFNSSGEKIGKEFRVNTTTLSSQADPAVASLENGKFVVTWEDSSLLGGDTSSWSIKAQMCNNDGSKYGPEFLVNTTTWQGQFNPVVADIIGSGYVIAWEGYGAKHGEINMQAFHEDGTRIGGETFVGRGYNPQVTALSDGKIVLLYERSAGIGFDHAIVAQIYNSDLSPLHSSMGSALGFTIGSSAAWNPIVSASSDGGFVVTWQVDDPAFPGNVTTNDDIYVQFFDNQGTKLAGELKIDNPINSGKGDPRIAEIDQGLFAVTWKDFTWPDAENSPLLYVTPESVFAQPLNRHKMLII